MHWLIKRETGADIFFASLVDLTTISAFHSVIDWTLEADRL